MKWFEWDYILRDENNAAVETNETKKKLLFLQLKFSKIDSIQWWRWRWRRRRRRRCQSTLPYLQTVKNDVHLFFIDARLNVFLLCIRLHSNSEDCVHMKPKHTTHTAYTLAPNELKWINETEKGKKNEQKMICIKRNSKKKLK